MVTISVQGRSFDAKLVYAGYQCILELVPRDTTLPLPPLSAL